MFFVIEYTTWVWVSKAHHMFKSSLTFDNAWVCRIIFRVISPIINSINRKAWATARRWLRRPWCSDKAKWCPDRGFNPWRAVRCGTWVRGIPVLHWRSRAGGVRKCKWVVAVHQGEAEGEANMWGLTQFKNYTQTQNCCNFDSIQTLPSESWKFCIKMMNNFCYCNFPIFKLKFREDKNAETFYYLIKNT
jgi:hypothetical protein